MKTGSSAVICVLLSTAFSPLHAQYAATPGDVPPVPDARSIPVEVVPPFASPFDIPGIEIGYAERLAAPNDTEIICRNADGVTIALLIDGETCTYTFSGDWGFTFIEFFTTPDVSQISPSGRYYAVGGDGTSVFRSDVYVVDLETGKKYRSTSRGIWNCSDWIEGDFLVIGSIGVASSEYEKFTRGDLESMLWINDSYMTEGAGFTTDIVLYRGGSSRIILPEDIYYGYRMTGTTGTFDSGIYFDVTASPNVVPSLAGFQSACDFIEWVDTTGREAAFPEFEFRVFVDTLTSSISSIQRVTAGTAGE